MATHTAHEPSLSVGLVDGCPRCEEHANNPLNSLDDDHLTDLLTRIIKDQDPRSTNEAIAMRNLEVLITSYAKLDRLLKPIMQAVDGSG